MKEDTSLESLLRDWKVSPNPDPRFRHGVWERIAAQSTRSSSGILAVTIRWLMISLPKPGYACALVALFALAGIAAADVRSASIQRRQNARLEQSYLTSIDPVAMADSTSRPTP